MPFSTKSKDVPPGTPFGRWTVVGPDPGGYKGYLVCSCACGEVRLVRKTLLVTGRSKSCGLCTSKSPSVIGWFARGGHVKRIGPFYTQLAATEAVRLEDGGFPDNVFVWPERVGGGIKFTVGDANLPDELSVKTSYVVDVVPTPEDPFPEPPEAEA